jgi:isocitrate/isopropylmalate dehydrogenase
MLLRYSCDAEAAARAIEVAVAGALQAGARTRDIAASGARDWLGTQAFTDVVLRHLGAH